jgi:TPR repeat
VNEGLGGSGRARLALDPNNHDTINLMGRVAFARGDLQEAVTHFGRAIKLKPNLADAYNNMGNTLKDVVADLEGQARRILAHCGLDWDPNCLQFHRTERPMRTARATQVRQPIYRSAIGPLARLRAVSAAAARPAEPVDQANPDAPRATVDSLPRTFSGGGKPGFRPKNPIFKNPRLLKEQGFSRLSAKIPRPIRARCFGEPKMRTTPEIFAGPLSSLRTVIGHQYKTGLGSRPPGDPMEASGQTRYCNRSPEQLYRAGSKLWPCLFMPHRDPSRQR